MKLETASHTSNLGSREPQDTNQVLCNKKALPRVTEENNNNSLSSFQLFSAGQAWSGCRVGLSGDLPTPAQQNANVKQTLHANTPLKNSRISCSL